MGLDRAIGQFLDGRGAIAQEVQGHTVDGFAPPPSQRVIRETRSDAGAAEADESVASVPGVSRCP